MPTYFSVLLRLFSAPIFDFDHLYSANQNITLLITAHSFIAHSFLSPLSYRDNTCLLLVLGIITTFFHVTLYRSFQFGGTLQRGIMLSKHVSLDQLQLSSLLIGCSTLSALCHIQTQKIIQGTRHGVMVCKFVSIDQL